MYRILNLTRLSASYRIIEKLQSRHVPLAKYIVFALISSLTVKGYAVTELQVRCNL